MNVDSYRQSINDALQAFAVQIEQLLEIFWRTVKEVYVELLLVTCDWRNPIKFTSTQYNLLKVLITLLLITITLIAYSWKIYGKVITDKFVKPSTLKEIQALKESVAKLELPKEHSPRL